MTSHRYMERSLPLCESNSTVNCTWAILMLYFKSREQKPDSPTAKLASPVRSAGAVLRHENLRSGAAPPAPIAILQEAPIETCPSFIVASIYFHNFSEPPMTSLK